MGDIINFEQFKQNKAQELHNAIGEENRAASDSLVVENDLSASAKEYEHRNNIEGDEQLTANIKILTGLRPQINSTSTAYTDALIRAQGLDDRELLEQVRNADELELQRHALWYCVALDTVITRRKQK